MMARRLQLEKLVIVQGLDFSPLTKIFHHFSQFFTPFLSHKCLIYRQLHINHGLISHYALAGNYFSGVSVGTFELLHASAEAPAIMIMMKVKIKKGTERIG
jgi:hypothetical protein